MLFRSERSSLGANQLIQAILGTAIFVSSLTKFYTFKFFGHQTVVTFETPFLFLCDSFYMISYAMAFVLVIINVCLTSSSAVHYNFNAYSLYNSVWFVSRITRYLKNVL